MSSQAIQGESFSLSPAGTPIYITTNSSTASEQIHSTGASGTTFHSIFLWLVNDTADDRIKVHLYWNPESTAAGDMNEARITKILGPYETLCISDGWRLGQGHNPWITGGGGHAQIEGYVENAGDVNKIKVIGYVDEVTQSGVA